MTTLDKIKLIDFYLHGVDRGVKIHYSLDVNEKGEQDSWYTDNKFNDLHYHISLDALRPVIVKLLGELYSTHIAIEDAFCIDKFDNLQILISRYFRGEIEFTLVFDSVVECINYLNEKEK